jgi:hypothetical protein
MTIQRTVFTNEDFWEFVLRPENADKNFELHEGVLVEVPSPSALHSLIVTEVKFYIRLGLSLGHESQSDVIIKTW